MMFWRNGIRIFPKHPPPGLVEGKATAPPNTTAGRRCYSRAISARTPWNAGEAVSPNRLVREGTALLNHAPLAPPMERGAGDSNCSDLRRKSPINFIDYINAPLRGDDERYLQSDRQASDRQHGDPPRRDQWQDRNNAWTGSSGSGHWEDRPWS